jgi:uncharacterized protein
MAPPRLSSCASTSEKIRVGVISDTHNLLRPSAVAFLRGSDFIIHAGDICNEKVLAELRALAPVTAVRGNNDKGDWARALPEIERVAAGEVTICIVHDLADLYMDLRAPDVQVVVCGHSHRPRIEDKGGVLFVNPGSAGPRRFRLPISAAEIIVEGKAVSARLTELE